MFCAADRALIGRSTLRRQGGLIHGLLVGRAVLASYRVGLGTCTPIRRYRIPEGGYPLFASSTPKSASPLAATTKSKRSWNLERLELLAVAQDGPTDSRQLLYTDDGGDARPWQTFFN